MVGAMAFLPLAPALRVGTGTQVHEKVTALDLREYLSLPHVLTVGVIMNPIPYVEPGLLKHALCQMRVHHPGLGVVTQEDAPAS